MSNEKTCYLDVYCWTGLSAGAIHYYAEIYDSTMKRSGRIKRPLSERDAVSINKRLRFMYSEEYYNLYKVEPGEMDYRFDTEEQAIEAAIVYWRDNYPISNKLVDERNKKTVYARK